ncbi:hypothetical protein [Actinomadura formosensis]|uniref:hypothetical protein n=1 Tax=Actinomadura formosensis TaxID=60706 RepID=UPI003D8E4AD3
MTSRPPGDPKKDWWTMDDIAAYWKVKPKTIRTYRTRDRGELPAEDGKFGATPVWKPKTVIGFKRPSAQTGRGRPARSEEAPAEGRDGE